MSKVQMEDRIVNFIRNSIDLVVGQSGYPVLANTLTEKGVATRQQLRYMENRLLVKVVDVKVPSKLVAGKFTTFKAYYTERNIPDYVKEQKEAK